MSDKIRWGILGAGSIAGKFCQGLEQSRTGKLEAVASRTEASARALAEQFGGSARVHATCEELLEDPEVDAVYIATPHPKHAFWAIRAAEAGKAILCEKPIGINGAQAMAIVEAARVHGVFLMEAFMYRTTPQTEKVVELIREGAIGEVQVIEASFSFNGPTDPGARVLSQETAGGGILDVGGYPMSMARLIAGAARGKPFLNPKSVKGVGALHPETATDAWAVAVADFGGGLLASLRTGVQLNSRNSVVVYGTAGHLEIPSPWFCQGREAGSSALRLSVNGKDPEEIEVTCDKGIYGSEAEAVGEALAAGKLECDAMPVADTLGNMAALDAWRQSFGFEYEEERAPEPVHGRKLRRSEGAPMKYGRVPGLDRDISRLVMGCDNQKTLSHAAIMFDDFFERGGNIFDTAYHYGGGLQERLLGRWIDLRGVRDQVAVIGKGVHTPLCFPEVIAVQLDQTLDRLQTDYVDIYFMHRDNLHVPVGEFVEALNEEVRRGRIRVFGGSNWTTERLREANAYAEANDLQPFSALSNNFSLARMNSPVWKGCIAASEPEQRKWLDESQLALFPWSSQARGFFTERAGRDKLDDAELVRVWYSDDNWERRDRAIEIAEKKGVTPLNIALAYVLHQKFPTFALIGPRKLEETATSMPGLNVELTDEEVAWLDLRE